MKEFFRDLTWTTLRTQGRSRLIATSYVWIVVVPILAKVCEKVSGHYSISIPWVKERTFDVVLGLPFSWKVFFFMALTFALGKGIYSIMCPALLQRYASFTDFNTRHPGPVNLKTWVRRAFISKTIDDGKKGQLKFRLIEILERRPKVEEDEEEPTVSEIVDALDLKSDIQRADVFDSLVSAFNRSSPVFLVSAYLLFRIGVALFLWVIAENAWYVVRL